MCTAVFSFHPNDQYEFALALNRDEFWKRPTSRAHFWNDLLAGQDLEGKGTWIALNPTLGRVSAVTNIRDGSRPNDPKLRSRGQWAIEQTHAPKIGQGDLSRYRRLNSLVYQDGRLVFQSHDSKQSELSSGLHAISNGKMNSDWPKVNRVKDRFTQAIALGGDLTQNIFECMSDSSVAEDKELPDTGIGLEWERKLSPIFIVGPDYGTRSTTLALFEKSGNVRWIERTYDRSGKRAYDSIFEIGIRR